MPDINGSVSAVVQVVMAKKFPGTGVTDGAHIAISISSLCKRENKPPPDLLQKNSLHIIWNALEHSKSEDVWPLSTAMGKRNVLGL